MAKNCTLAVGNYGSIQVWARTLAYGFKLVYSESSGRNARTLYMDQVTDGGFVLGVQFNGFGEYSEFGRWMQGYGDAVGNVMNDKVRPDMRVTVPLKGFDQTGVPTDGMTFGADNRTAAPRMLIQFVGARTLVDYQTSVSSRFLGVAESSSKEAQYFYPAGPQLKGNEAGADFLYDNPQTEHVTVDMSGADIPQPSTNAIIHRAGGSN